MKGSKLISHQENANENCIERLLTHPLEWLNIRRQATPCAEVVGQLELQYFAGGIVKLIQLLWKTI